MYLVSGLPLMVMPRLRLDVLTILTSNVPEVWTTASAEHMHITTGIHTSTHMVSSADRVTSDRWSHDSLMMSHDSLMMSHYSPVMSNSTSMSRWSPPSCTTLRAWCAVATPSTRTPLREMMRSPTCRTPALEQRRDSERRERKEGRKDKRNT